MGRRLPGSRATASPFYVYLCYPFRVPLAMRYEAVLELEMGGADRASYGLRRGLLWWKLWEPLKRWLDMAVYM